MSLRPPDGPLLRAVPGGSNLGEPQRGGSHALTVDAAHAEVFDLEEYFDAVFRAPVTRQIGPMPLSFMPPKGAISVEMMPSLKPTMPY
jgi:hypothetical protein